MSKVTKILGCAGAGKTTYLLDTVEEYMSQGLKPENIGFFSFTKAAVREAVDRAVRKFPQYPRNAFAWFRTLHSLAFRVTGAAYGQLVAGPVLAEFGSINGYQFRGSYNSHGFYSGVTLEDKMLSLHLMAKEQGLTPREAYEKSDLDTSLHSFLTFSEYYEKFKEKNGYIDFSDMLIQANAQGIFPHFSLLILDEAQDFTPVQWESARLLMSNAEHTYVAGDDLQILYTYRGVEPEDFISLPSDDVVKLEKSYRVPSKIQRFAYKVAESRIQNKTDKQLLPKQEEGIIRVLPDVSYVDFDKYKSYLILARNAAYLADIMEALKNMGIPATYNGVANFSTQLKNDVRDYLDGRKTDKDLESDEDWHFFNSARAAKRLLDFSRPRVELSTIHGAKGREADCVVLVSDLTKASANELQTDPDTYYRLLYTAITRTKQELCLLEPKGKYHYSFRGGRNEM